LPPGVPAADVSVAVIATLEPAVVVAGVVTAVVLDAGVIVTENADELEAVNWV
jgi:hypothetical protein